MRLRARWLGGILVRGTGEQNFFAGRHDAEGQIDGRASEIAGG